MCIDVDRAAARRLLQPDTCGPNCSDMKENLMKFRRYHGYLSPFASRDLVILYCCRENFLAAERKGLFFGEEGAQIRNIARAGMVLLFAFNHFELLLYKGCCTYLPLREKHLSNVHRQFSRNTVQPGHRAPGWAIGWAGRCVHLHLADTLALSSQGNHVPLLLFTWFLLRFEHNRSASQPNSPKQLMSCARALTGSCPSPREPQCPARPDTRHAQVAAPAAPVT